MRLVAGPLPWSLAIALYTATLSTIHLMLAVINALSIIRVFIVVKVTVDKRPPTNYTWFSLSADDVQ